MKSVKTNIRSASMVRLCMLVLAIAFGHIAYGQPAAELYKNANNLYKAKQFQQAADEYEKITAQGYKNAQVYYNLGNCYYKLNNIGKSILSYERALKFSPEDEDIRHNLKLAELKVTDRIQPVPQLAIINWWNDFVSSQSSGGWGMFSLAAVWLALLSFAVAFFIGFKRIFNFLAIVLLVLSFSFLYFASGQKQKENGSSVAILMVPSSNIKSAPDANASDLFLIHEGTRLRIADQVGSWYKIRLADGKVGWIEKENFEKI